MDAAASPAVVAAAMEVQRGHRVDTEPVLAAADE